MKKGDLLFVYGTLRKGETADLTRVGGLRVDHIGKDRINGEMFNTGWYPGAKVTPAEFSPDLPVIVGDLFLLRDDTVVQHLDAYEGYPELFNRVETDTENGKRVWVYTYNHEVQATSLIDTGDWTQRSRA